MSMESDLVALLKTICSNVYPDVAPEGVARPYVVWQQLGGDSARLLSNQAGDKRNAYMQIAVWSETRLAALELIHQIEDAMCASLVFAARPQGQSLSTYEPDTQLYGSIQRFSIWAAR